MSDLKNTSQIDLFTEYLLLDPPRSLQQLAAARGQSIIPPEWEALALSEDWQGQATLYDAASNERRLRTNWVAANQTQLQALKITDKLMADINNADRGTGEDPQKDAATLQSLANALKTVVTVRLSILEGLERPDTASALPPVQVSQRPMTDRQQRHKVMEALWGKGYNIPPDPVQAGDAVVEE